MGTTRTWLYVDDQANTVRAHAAAQYTHHALTSTAALALLRGWAQSGTRPDVVSLDHDLRNTDTTRPIVLWWCEHGNWPHKILVHTQNPVGAEWLVGMCQRYAPAGVAVHRTTIPTHP